MLAFHYGLVLHLTTIDTQRLSSLTLISSLSFEFCILMLVEIYAIILGVISFYNLIPLLVAVIVNYHIYQSGSHDIMLNLNFEDLCLG